jgi:hypothetical protein
MCQRVEEKTLSYLFQLQSSLFAQLTNALGFFCMSRVYTDNQRGPLIILRLYFRFQLHTLLLRPHEVNK